MSFDTEPTVDTAAGQDTSVDPAVVVPEAPAPEQAPLAGDASLLQKIEDEIQKIEAKVFPPADTSAASTAPAEPTSLAQELGMTQAETPVASVTDAPVAVAEAEPAQETLERPGLYRMALSADGKSLDVTLLVSTFDSSGAAGLWRDLGNLAGQLTG